VSGVTGVTKEHSILVDQQHAKFSVGNLTRICENNMKMVASKVVLM
jgi:hypothetical protein